VGRDGRRELSSFLHDQAGTKLSFATCMDLPWSGALLLTTAFEIAGELTLLVLFPLPTNIWKYREVPRGATAQPRCHPNSGVQAYHYQALGFHPYHKASSGVVV